MRKISALALFLTSLLTAIPSSAQTYNIILGRPTASSVTISILFDQNAGYRFIRIRPGTGSISWFLKDMA